MSIALDRYFVICHHSKSIMAFNEHMSMQVKKFFKKFFLNLFFRYALLLSH